MGMNFPKINFVDFTVIFNWIVLKCCLFFFSLFYYLFIKIFFYFVLQLLRN
jgi:hypothetical protein